MAVEAKCSQAKEDLIELSKPDTPDLSINQQFFPRDSILQLLTKERTLDILTCRCQKCQEDSNYQVIVERSHEYASRIVGNERGERSPADTAVSLFALLIYIGRPLFIIGFLSRDGGANDNTLEIGLSSFKSKTLQETYWPKYLRMNPRGAAALASEFKWHIYQFAVPHMKDPSYSVYDGRTIMPFVNETPLGEMSEDGEFKNPGAYGRVFAFDIWPEYNRFPHAREVRRFARKELKDTPPKWFRAEKDNLDKVSLLNDKHIVKIIKAYRHGGTFNIIFPLAKTNLYQYLRDPQFETDDMHAGLPELNPLWNQVSGITKALHRIISFDVSDPTSDGSFYGFHFDLKPENILIQDDNSFVISDFGQATFKKVGGTSSRVIGNGGTDAFAPPEIDNLNTKQSGKYDIWSLGCILVEIATFVARGRAGLRSLDEIRHTKLLDSNKEDDRFFESVPGTEGFRMKPAISSWITGLPSSPQIRAGRSRQFMEEIVVLSQKMLTIDVEKRIPSSETTRLMRDILQKYQTDPVAPVARVAAYTAEGNESSLGTQILGNIKTMWYHRNDDWVKAMMSVFEDPHGYLRLVILGNGSPDTYLGARSDVKLIPRYIWDSEERRSSEQERKLSESSLYFSPMDDRGPRVFNRIKFSFSDLKEARIIQSLLTGQCVYESFTLDSVSHDVCPSLTRKILSLCRSGKGPSRIKADESAFAVQLWSEMTYADPASRENTRARPQHGRSILHPHEATRRRVVILYRKKIVTIPMAKNVVVEKPTEDGPNDVLRFVPTDKTRDKYFLVSELQSTPHPSDEDPYPGIPLCKSKLRDLEEQTEFDCRYFELKFRRPEDLKAFYKKYLVLKENWAKENRAIFGRGMRESYRTARVRVK